MKTFEPWESVNGTVTKPEDESKEPWDGDQLGPERPYMRDYSQTLTMKIIVAFQDKSDSNKSNVLLRFDEVLELIKEIDTLTLKIPKIVYLVGWNAMGHDDKYPSWNIVNSYLCHPGSKNPIEDLRWLMREAQKYHTSVSLHLNSTDAYKDSPLWEECKTTDLISTRDRLNFITGTWNDKDAYQINYKNAWETGFYKNQVDNLLDILPELKLAGTIHSDAFLCRWSDQSSYEEEQAARRQMIRYWRDCGLDLTSEFIYGSVENGREDVLGALNGNNVMPAGLVGLMPYVWHLAQTDFFWHNRPVSLLAGGGIPHFKDPFVIEKGAGAIAFLYGCSMQGENIFLNYCLQRKKENGVALQWETEFSSEFFTTTVMYVYLNRFKNIHITKSTDKIILTKDGGLVAKYSNDPEKRTIKKDGKLIRKDNDIFVPVSWIKEFPAVAAFSEKGYKDMSWTLLSEWEGFDSADIYCVSKNGLDLLHKNVPVLNQLTVKLCLSPKQSVLIIPSGKKL